MNEIIVQPDVYSTGKSKNLLSILEQMWLYDKLVEKSTFYLVSSFANYNGGIRFYSIFREHVKKGGKIVAIFGGSSQQNLSSKQVVEEMLACGADVYIVNRKQLMHVKSYGLKSIEGDSVVVTSGNFTGPGMSQNVEMSVFLDHEFTNRIGFKWENMVSSMLSQKWDLFRPELEKPQSPPWKLLYDEKTRRTEIYDSEKITMILCLGHADTVRINATRNSKESRGTQYFWLSRDCYEFFPALTILNQRGIKRTYSCIIHMNFVDINSIQKVRVTFEAENNLDFRLGTGPLRYTKLARMEDIAAISRVGDFEYELRLYRKNSKYYNALVQYATNFIGHQGKRYGYISNEEFEKLVDVSLSSKNLDSLWL